MADKPTPYPERFPWMMFEHVRRAESRANRLYEPVIGLVTDIKDPEKLGRIKVKFPTLPGDDTSFWAPMVSLGGGKDRGWWFLPEINDEVVVLFEHGDVNRPMVIGALWSDTDKPPESNSGSNPKRKMVSREGSFIEFDDDEGKITLEDGGGIGKIIISTENKITIEATQGNVVIHAKDDDMTVVAKEVKAEGSQNFHFKAGGDAKIGSDAKVEIKGSKLEVQASKIDIQPGGVQAPQAATASPEEVPDPLG